MISKITNMKYFKISYAVLLNVAILGLFLYFFDVCYEMADDSTYAQFIANGCYDFVFINYFLCTLIGVIQKIIFPINAYVVFQLLISCLCFISILKILLDKFTVAVSTAFFLFIIGIFAVNHYETISFTRSAGLVAFTGFLCIFHYLYYSKSIFGYILGTFFLLIGISYRVKVFYVVAGITTCFVIGVFLSKCFASNNIIKNGIEFIKEKVFKKRTILLFLSVCLCFVTNLSSQLINTSTAENAYYAKYVVARSQVWDYSIPDYEQCQGQYDAISIDSNDIKMIRSGYFDDQGATSLEKLSDIKKIRDEYKTETKRPLQIIKDMIWSEIGNIKAIGDKGIVLAAFLIVLMLFLLIAKKNYLFIPLMLFIGIFTVYSVLWLFMKVPFRAVYMLWISSTVYLIYYLPNKDFNRPFRRAYIKWRKSIKTFGIVLVCLLSITGLYLTNLANDSLPVLKISNNISKLREYVLDNKDIKYEFARNSGVSAESVDIFHVSDKKIPNTQMFNCTYYRLPYIDKQISEFGTDNLYSNLLKDNVYFVSSDIETVEMMKKYLNKYYSNNRNVTYELIETVDGCGIYDFS